MNWKPIALMVVANAVVAATLPIWLIVAGVNDSKKKELEETASKITPVKLQYPDWEGILWKDHKGNTLGLAVREVKAEGEFRETNYAWSETYWGNCGEWSQLSPGKYCLIPRSELTRFGVFVVEQAENPEVTNAIP